MRNFSELVIYFRLNTFDSLFWNSGEYFQRLHFLSHTLIISIDRKKISETLFLVNFVKFWAIMHFEKLSEYRRLSFPDIDTASPKRHIPTKHGSHLTIVTSHAKSCFCCHVQFILPNVIYLDFVLWYFLYSVVDYTSVNIVFSGIVIYIYIYI